MKDHKQIILTILRITFGILFLYAGIDKLMNEFSAAGYLNNVATGPFASMLATMAGSAVVDFLVVWGEILIGLALILGVAIRFTSAMGILMMALFYISVLPPEHGPVTEHIIYILVFLTLASQGAGRYWGVDSWLEKQEFFKGKSYFNYLLG